MYGLGGNDALSGGDGNDLIYGGTGDDIIEGALGDDELVGGGGIYCIANADTKKQQAANNTHYRTAA